MKNLFISILAKLVVAVFIFLSAICDNYAGAQRPVQQAEIMPRFREGGLEEFVEWVESHCICPQELYLIDIKGNIDFSFIVGKDGFVSDVQIISSPHPLLSWEVKAVVESSPKWTPGRNGRRKIPVVMYASIFFDIEEIKHIEQMVPDNTEVLEADIANLRRYVFNNLVLPADLYDREFKEIVTVRFIVDKDGSINNVIVLQSPNNELTNSIINLFEKAPKWTPAMKDGEAIRLHWKFPIRFEIDGGGIGRSETDGQYKRVPSDMREYDRRNISW